jgi:ribosomal protein L1
MVKIGLRDFDEAAIFSNFDALAKALVSKRPESVKGNSHNQILILACN